MRRQYHFRQIGPDVCIWDVHKLVRLAKTLEPVMIPVSDIGELDEDWWFKDTDAQPTPRQIVDHMRLVQNASLDHPIILCSAGRLMDGMHRVAKALFEGHERILAVQLPVTPKPDFLNVAAGDLSYAPEDI